MSRLCAMVAAARDEVSRQLDAACRDVGFFYIVGHGVDEGLQRRLEALSREFFGLPEDEKARIGMAEGGRAWRGWFPVGGELTSGVPDRKEGIYFGAELGPDHPRVAAGVPLHGPNLFPARPAGPAWRGPGVHGGDDGPGSPAVRSRSPGAGTRRRLVRHPPDRRSHRAVPHLPLPAEPGRRRPGRGRPASGGGVWPSTPTTGC